MPAAFWFDDKPCVKDVSWKGRASQEITIDNDAIDLTSVEIWYSDASARDSVNKFFHRFPRVDKKRRLWTRLW